jgi:hypothetical protein
MQSCKCSCEVTFSQPKHSLVTMVATPLWNSGGSSGSDQCALIARASPRAWTVSGILPGLDACKEELHAWAQAFVDRGMAALTLDGPGQGETSFRLPTTPEWGPVLGAVIDVLEKRNDVDGSRVGIGGQSLGAIYAPLVAAGEPRIKACIANCGPYDWGRLAEDARHLSGSVSGAQSRQDDG